MSKTENTPAVPGAFSFGDKETLPAHLQTGSSRGNENVDSDSLIMPKLNLLQALSPQVSTVEGARPGLIHNSLTDDLYKEVFVVNLRFDKQYSVFKKRELGGGYFGQFESEEAAREAISELDGNARDYDAQLTHIHTCLLLDENGTPIQPVLIYFANTKLAISEKWNTDLLIRCKDTDRFGAVYKISTTEQANKVGQKYFNFNCSFAGWPSEALFEEASANYEALTAQKEAQKQAA